MRILFTFSGGSGHLNPLVPLARAADAAGHVVAFAGRPWMVTKVEAAGFPAFATGSDLGLRPERRPLRKPDPGHEERALRDGFARRIARERAADVVGLCADWQTDFVVSEETDFGPMVVAERLGLPHATVLVTAAGSFVRPEIVAEPLNELRAEHGLPPDPDLTMPSRDLVLSPFPPSFRDPDYPLPPTAHSVRLAAVDPAPEDVVPPWLEELDGATTVYFTLGTVFNVEAGDLFHRVLAGLRDLPINLVVTVGHDLDPAELGPQPANVHVEQYIAEAALLPHCSLVVSHGGSGSVLGALAHGLPMVLIPMGADQPLNAARCEALGVARVVDAVRTPPRAVREAVTAGLEDRTARRAARRLADEIAGLPGPAHAVALLEQLAASRRSVPSA